MAQILVRDLDDDIVQQLKDRAKRDGRSLQAEVKTILEQAARKPTVDWDTARTLVDDIRQQFKGRAFPASVDLIREDRE